MGGYFQSDFELTPVVANNYIPLIAIQSMQTKGDNLLFYSKPSFINVLRKPNTLKNIKDGFELSMTARRIEINGRVFFIAKGVFFSEAGMPLMVCAMKKEAYNDPSVSNFSEYRADNFSYNNYVLFYSTSFYTDPGLTPLNRRLQKEILQSCYEKGIEVRTITSLEIEKNTFARVFEVKKTKSLTQLEAYMQQVLPNFLHNGGEDTFIEKEFEPIVLAHEEELSVEDEALLFDNETQTEEEFDDDEIWDEDVDEDESLPEFYSENFQQPNILSNSISPVIPNRQLTLDEVIEMAELEAEAATFNHPLEPEIDWATVETAVDQQETAHTVFSNQTTSGYVVSHDPYSNEVIVTNQAQTLIERMRPMQDAYNVQMLQAQQRGQLQAEREVVRGWQSVIELIDDTE